MSETTFKPDRKDLRIIVIALTDYAAKHSDEDAERLARVFRGWQR